MNGLGGVLVIDLFDHLQILQIVQKLNVVEIFGCRTNYWVVFTQLVKRP